MGRFFTGWRAAEPESALKAPSITSSPGLELTSNTSSESSSLTSSPQPTTPPGFDDRDTTMPTTSPITIATPSRTSSSSPSSHGQKSNYHDSTAADTRTSAMMSNTGFDSSMGGRGGQNSFVGGAQPISMNNPNRNQDGRARRESLAGSLVNGMSWGGVSVGSWIRDDIMMTGTSPFHMQSPSYHSSSYLPKLEAEFMRNFACCGQTLPSLHDLLQHYEECHAESTPQSRSGSLAARARENSTPNSKAHYQSEAANKILQQQSQNPQGQPSRPQIQIGQGSGVGGISALRQQQSQPSTPIQQKAQPAAEDMDGVEDMEMDDPVGPMDMSADLSVKPVNQPVQGAQQSMFGQQPRPQLNLNSSGMQHSGLRNNISQPTTPSTSGFGFNNNPTVSSVNTPTLSAQPMQQQQTFSPDTSVPGTPAEYEDDLAKFPNIDMGIGSMNFNNINFPYGLGGNDMGLDLCIDEPAKRLYSPNGGFNNQQRQQFAQFAQFGLNPTAQAQFGGGANESAIRAYQIQQMRAMGAGGLTPQQTAAMMMPGEEHKPFKCPVIGCEKAYKNQNGLKYHKTHGHTTQQLHENGDGTFSIVNPETSAPYPGTLGMEKEKPYKCEVCGKRYKNLNGLKYHKQHSPPCNPELKLNHHMAAVGLPGLNVNVAGFPGIPEEGMPGMM